MRCTHFRGNKQKGYNRSCYECERSPITVTFCMLRYYTRFESMGCTVLFSVSISFLNSAPLRTALIMFVRVRRCRDPSPLGRLSTFLRTGKPAERTWRKHAVLSRWRTHWCGEHHPRATNVSLISSTWHPRLPFDVSKTDPESVQTSCVH